MISIELVEQISTVANLTLGLEDLKMLDEVIEKILAHPYLEDGQEFKVSTSEYLMLSNIADKIGKSGMRKYIGQKMNN